jgi:uncharacterized protein YndB with AHSA1/START domain
MTPARTQSVSAERIVATAPHQIFDVLTDPNQHPVLDGSGMVQSSRRRNPKRLQLGSKFRMDMKLGPLPYRITNTVVEFEANRLIAWQHQGRHRWRWELEPAAAGGTRVRESFDWSTALWPRGLELVGYPERNLEAIEQTLDRLVQHFEAPPAR